MKKYTSTSTKWLAILSAINALMLLIGIILIIFNAANIELQFLLTAFGSSMSILFLPIFFAERSRWLTIDEKTIDLPRGAKKNEKISFKRTVIDIEKIRSFEYTLHKGDGIISKDARFYTLTLKDSTTIEFTLYAYGKEAEEEIWDAIKNSI